MTPEEEGQVVVLAGGMGTRLSSLAPDVPKALRPVGGRPFLDVMLDQLVRQGFRRFHFCLGHLGDRLTQHLETFDASLEVTIKVESPLCGTAGALLGSAHLLDDVFLLAMGDTYLEHDHNGLLDALPDAADGVLVVTRAASGVTPNVRLAGTTVVEYDKAGVRDGWIDTGVAALRRRALDLLAGAPAPMDLSSLFRRLIERRALVAVTTDRRFFDIGTPERYLELDAHLAGLAGDVQGAPAS